MLFSLQSVRVVVIVVRQLFCSTKERFKGFEARYYNFILMNRKFKVFIDACHKL